MLAQLAGAKQIAKDLLESRRWPDRPQTINVEITAACDARCIHCPRFDMDRPMKAMAMDLFQRLIDQAGALKVPYLCPNGYGEICTIPVSGLEAYLEVIASSGHRFKVLINSNGHRMTEDRSALFVKHGVRLVNVTIDGATAATAEAIRRNLSFERVEANVKRLLALRDAMGATYPKVRVGMIAMPQTIPEVEPFLARWRGVADFVGIGGFSSRLTSVASAGRASSHIPVSEPPAGRRARACVLPFRDLNVWADGKVVLCCEDWNEELVIGDLRSQTLDAIWHGDAIGRVRASHLQGAGTDVALCARCDSWQRPSGGARLWS